jgi:subtilisin family serine protease
MGYDDRHSDELPLIVRRAAGVRSIDGASPLEPVASLASIRATSAVIGKDDAAELGDDLATIERPGRTRAELGGATKIWLDCKFEADALDGYLTQVSAPAAWSAGLTGAGVTVAVLDTGVDAGHPAPAGQVDAQANFTDAGSPADGNGHWTHVATRDSAASRG